MSSRRRRRSPRRKLPALAWVFMGLAAITLAVPFFATAWTKRYVQSDAFRQVLSRQVSNALGVEGEFAPLRWLGMEMTSPEFAGTGGHLGSLRLREVRAQVDLSSYRRKAWAVPEVSVQQAEIILGQDTRRPINQPLAPLSTRPNWWSRWLPQETKIKKVTVAALALGSSQGQWKVAEGKLSLTPIEGTDGWKARLQDGQATVAGWPEVEIEEAVLRLAGQQIFLDSLQASFLNEGRLEAEGEWNTLNQLADFTLRVSSLPVERALRPDWRQRLSGMLHANVRLQGQDARAGRFPSGRVWLKNGVLEALPVLDELADYTKTARFRRVALDEASCEFEQKEDHLALTKVTLRSEGLMRLEGRMVIQHGGEDLAQRPMSGVFRLGLAAETLKWLPGAQAKVFTESEAGYQWTDLRLAGTLASPREDLSPRLKEAALIAGVEAVPKVALESGRQAVDLLDRAQDEILRQAPPVLDTAKALLEETSRFVPLLDLGK